MAKCFILKFCLGPFYRHIHFHVYVLAFLLFASTEVLMRLFYGYDAIISQFTFDIFFKFITGLTPIWEMFRTTNWRATMTRLNLQNPKFSVVDFMCRRGVVGL
jgi:hypothetical protein